MRLSSASLAAATLFATAQAAHYDVTVGKDNQLKFVPETLSAKVGDYITYHFYSKNHSVTQSSFDQPCQPLKEGFFSGFTPAASESVEAPTIWTIQVQDVKPIWVYCGQGPHCQTGMLQSINAPSSGNTHEAFKEKAKAAPPSTSPPDGLPVGGNRVFRVDVGAGGNLVFSPNDIRDLPRTHVQFSFNPKNHSVTESSFDKPCQPVDDGFSSGLIPTALSPSGVLFDIIINDTKPVWFYCAQTTGTHCQKGMVGSINAPLEGKTLQAFTELAKTAPSSTLPPNAPIGGVLTANGTVIPTINSAVIDVSALDDDKISYIPKPGENDQYMMGMAGGGAITNYGWGLNISDVAVKQLQLIQFIDNLILKVLFEGFEKLNAGAWQGIYPKTIVHTIGAMAAQAWIHRATATDTLQHYSKTVLRECSYQLPTFNVDDFLHVALTLFLLQIGMIIDSLALIAESDPWLVPCLATSLGAKSRMTAVINLMQNHLAAAAPREVSLPGELVYSYAMNNYVASCPDKLPWDDVALPPLKVTNKETEPTTGRVTKVTVALDSKVQHSGNLWMAWLGPWGSIRFTPIEDDHAAVPGDLYGHVWVVVTRSKDLKLRDVYKEAVAGPQMVWISDL